MNWRPVEEALERQRREPDAVYKERLERLEKAVGLGEPDRPPLYLIHSGAYFAKWYKLSEVYFNYDLMRKCVVRFVESYPCDVLSAMMHATAHAFLLMFPEHPDVAIMARYLTGPVHDVLGDTYTRWPGREIPREDVPFQFVGGTYMSVEEYGRLAEGPSEFFAEAVFPRVCPRVGRPGSSRHISALVKWGVLARDYANTLIAIVGDMRARGTPSLGPLTVAFSPLDIIADFMRGLTNTMVDLRRRPDDVRRAVEVITEVQLKIVKAHASLVKARWCFIPLHLNEMLPPRLYNEFYWPYLRRTIVELYNMGVRSLAFFEGDHTPHLETILELPRGWGIAYFERTDVRKAKKVLGGHTCIMGGVAPSVLVRESPEAVEHHIKALLDEVAPGGGYIVSLSVSEVPAEIPEANLMALINAVIKHGTSRA